MSELPSQSWEFDALQSVTAGRYVLERTIGRGSTGIVFLAHDIMLDRAVAIKMLNADVAPDPQQRESFLQEARTAARLAHPNVVPIHSVDEEGDVVFFVMGYVDGETVGSRVEHNGPLSYVAARRMMQEVAWALSYAHASGVVHRDIKPDNVLLERLTGRALVTDFGIARVQDVHEEGLANVVVGTPLFMSPEQASGEDVDHRSDIYSLGATVFFAVTGKPPFEGGSVAELLFKRIHEPAPSVESYRQDLPRPFTELVDRCLATGPADRIEHAAAIAERLDELRVVGRDIPRPVQEFQKLSDRVAHRLIVLVPVGGVLVYALSAIGDLRAEHSVLFLWVVWILVAELIVEPFGLILAARQLQQDGITYEAFREALRWQAVTDRPARHVTIPIKIQFAIGLLALLGAFGTLVAALVGTGIPDQTRLSLRSFGVASALFAAVALGSVFITEWGTSDSGPRQRRSAWAGSFGRWFFALARMRLNLGTMLGYQARRPAELILSETIGLQINDLPTAVKDKLRGVADRVARIVTRSKAMRHSGSDNASDESQDLKSQIAQLEQIRQGLVKVRDGTLTIEQFIEEHERDVVPTNPKDNRPI